MHKRFSYKSGEELLFQAKELELDIPWNEDYQDLYEGLQVGKHRLPNRFVVHPMEGFDSMKNGAPGPLSFRRYKRFAAGGSGLIWIEATSVSQEGRSNPAQLHLNKHNWSEFLRLTDSIKGNATAVGDPSGTTTIVMQLTHSGRYSKPLGIPEPLVALKDLRFDADLSKVKELSDDDLKRIRDAHVEAACLAEKSGVDLVDLKICHGYLLHELLFARGRKNSIYGGPSLEQRMRLPIEIITGIKETTKLGIAMRLNVFDGLEGGFGMDDGKELKPNLTEVKDLMYHFEKQNIALWSITAGIPYLNPWVGRPFNLPATNATQAPEHPLTGVDRLIKLTREIRNFTKVPVVGAGLSWLRMYYPQVASGIIHQNYADLVGMGRMAFAYPDLVMELYEKNEVNAKKVCVACSGCTNRMRSGLPAGCIIRDLEVYAQK